MLRDAVLVAGKDLRVERRSKVVLNQLAPFTLLLLVLFGFALDANRAVLRSASSGLFWIAVLFAAVLAVQRGVAVESAPGLADALRLSGLEPAGVFLGKSAALYLELLALEVLLGAGVVVLYDARIDRPVLLVATCLVATAGVAVAGTIYGALVAGLRVRETILPILLLPVLAPVLIGATRAFDDALGAAAIEGWNWLALLAAFSLVYAVVGVLAYGTLLEET